MINIDLSGRNGLILGVANRRSLAWAIAEQLDAAGMRLALTYQGDRLRENAEKLALAKAKALAAVKPRAAPKEVQKEHNKQQNYKDYLH